MQVAKDKVVAIDYTLTDDEGNVLDSSVGREPLAYLHGWGNIIPGLEKALEGKQAGDNLTVRVPAAEAYGERDDSLTQQVPRELFMGVDELEVGMRFQAQTNQGVQIVTITEIYGDVVTVDGNENIKPMKNKSKDRIDLTVALIDAMATAMLFEEISLDVSEFADEAFLNKLWG